MCAMDPCLTPLGSPKSRALSHHKAPQKINPIGHSIVVNPFISIANHAIRQILLGPFNHDVTFRFLDRAEPLLAYHLTPSPTPRLVM